MIYDYTVFTLSRSLLHARALVFPGEIPAAKQSQTLPLLIKTLFRRDVAARGAKKSGTIYSSHWFLSQMKCSLQIFCFCFYSRCEQRKYLFKIKTSEVSKYNPLYGVCDKKTFLIKKGTAKQFGSHVRATPFDFGRQLNLFSANCELHLVSDK